MEEARLAKALEGLARTTLLKAWIDFYAGAYDWALEKAYRAAATVLAPHTQEPSLSMQALRQGCSEDLARELQVLDYRRRLAQSPLLRLLHGEEEVSPGKGEALDSIEVVVKLLDSIGSCTPAGDPAGQVLDQLLDYGVAWGATVLLQGDTAYIIRDQYTGTQVKSRIMDPSLPLGPSLVLLAPDEAVALLHLPQGRGLLAGAEVLTDRAGIAHILL
ncbi:MAG: hypothetical protein GSR84_02345 [Desulfurococcales archaeon]|nr:hypothetical protein [Desulfurococcales archaeon]